MYENANPVETGRLHDTFAMFKKIRLKIKYINQKKTKMSTTVKQKCFAKIACS